MPYDCILVVEAGPYAPDEDKINVPGMKGSTIGTKYDWNFTTVTQPGANNRSWAQARGKVLGGSSALNLMTWDRASVHDYDAWQELGNPGWNSTTMFEGMLRCENYVRTKGTYGKKGVGIGGPIQALINELIPTQQLTWIPTMNALGVPFNNQSLDGNPLGVMYQPSNIRWSNYTRSYAPSYLNIASPNFHVIENTEVTKVNFKKQAGQLVATGVVLNGTTTVNATKEVILSAGSFKSPALLELSGVGNSTILKAAGITPLLSLPNVGENLQDHVRIQNSYQLKDNYTSFDELKNTTYAAQQLALWHANQKSEYDYTGSGYAFMTWTDVGNHATMVSLAKKSANKTSAIDARKLAYLTNKTFATSVPQLEVIFSDGYTGVKGYPASTDPLYGKQFFTLIAAIQHTFARGTVHINASDPGGKPVIDPRYLSNPYDLAAAVAATQYMRRIASTAPMRYTWDSEYEPGAAVNTTQEWETFARNTSLTIYHPIGTCAMLPREEGGVVSPELKVYGTRNLRVVDASVIPVIISAHMQTAVYGIAERAAEIISEEWGY